MTEFQKFVLSLLSAAGVSAALSGVVLWLARNWISERLKNSIKHEYELKLSTVNAELRMQADLQTAQLKASIEKEAEKIRFATSSIGESQKAAIARKLRKLPCQVDSLKVEFPEYFSMNSAGVMSARESWGRSSL